MNTVRRAARCVSLGLTGLLLGCGTGQVSVTGDAGPTDLPTPTALTCPSGEMVGTAGGYLSRWPSGPDDIDELVAENSTPEEPWVRVGRSAYVLRPDGTASEVHHLSFGPKGWFLQGYEACVD